MCLSLTSANINFGEAPDSALQIVLEYLLTGLWKHEC